MNRFFTDHDNETHEHAYNDATGYPLICPVERCDFGMEYDLDYIVSDEQVRVLTRPTITSRMEYINQALLNCDMPVNELVELSRADAVGELIGCREALRLARDVIVQLSNYADSVAPPWNDAGDEQFKCSICAQNCIIHNPARSAQ